MYYFISTVVDYYSVAYRDPLKLAMDQIVEKLEDHLGGLGPCQDVICPGSGLDLWGSGDTLKDMGNIVEDIGIEDLQAFIFPCPNTD